MIDGKWITKEICLIIYYEYIQKKVIYFSFYWWERYEDIKQDLEVLKNSFKYDLKTITIDGSKQIFKAIQEIFPEVKIQRCLTHIQRQVIAKISRNPQTQCGKDLQKIIKFSHFKNEKKFRREFLLWNTTYDTFLKEKSSNWITTWYTHRSLRSARSHIKNALPYMFTYRKFYKKKLKRSSNDIESKNLFIDEILYDHRGLKKERLFATISLYIYHKNYNEI